MTWTLCLWLKLIRGYIHWACKETHVPEEVKLFQTTHYYYSITIKLYCLMCCYYNTISIQCNFTGQSLGATMNFENIRLVTWCENANKRYKLSSEVQTAYDAICAICWRAVHVLILIQPNEYFINTIIRSYNHIISILL